MTIQENIPLLSRKIVREDSIKLKNPKEMREGDIIPFVSDTMFKIILGSESKKKNTAYLLSLLLNRDKKEIEENMIFVKKEQDQEKYKDSKRVVDLIIKLDNKYYNIELNNNTAKEGLERNIDYANRIFASKRTSGSFYVFESIYQFNLNNFFFENMEEEEIENTFVYQSMDKYKRILTDKIVLRYFYLPRIRKRYYNKIKLSELEKLLLVLTSEKVGDFPDLLEENDMLRNVQEEMYKASVDDEVIGEYDAEFEAEFNMVTRIREERLEIAKNLLKMNFPLEKISQATGVELEVLEKMNIE